MRYNEKDNELEQIITERVNSLFSLLKSELEQNYENKNKIAENENKRLLVATQAEVSALQEESAAKILENEKNSEEKIKKMNKRSRLILVVCIIVGLVGGGFVTNRVFNAHQVKTISELEATVESQNEKLSSEFFTCTFSERSYLDDRETLLIVSSTNKEKEHKFRKGDLVRYIGRSEGVDSLFSMADYVVFYRGEEWNISYSDFQLYFNKCEIPY